MAAGWHSMLAAALRCATSFELQLLEISFSDLTTELYRS